MRYFRLGDQEKYIMNLKEDIGTQVRPLKSTTLYQAQQEALESEVWFKERNRGRTRAPQNLPQRPNKPATSPFQKQVTTNQVKYSSLSNPLNHSIPLQQRLQLFCNFCKNVDNRQLIMVNNHASSCFGQLGLSTCFIFGIL